MRWVLSNSGRTHETYELLNNDKVILTLYCNNHVGTARVECSSERRIFLIEKEGFLSKTIFLRNEYGIKIGQFGFDKPSQKGIIELNDEKFFYEIDNDPLAKLVIYKTSKERPLLVCGLAPEDDIEMVHFSKKDAFPKMSHACLLMALCWYLFLPIAKENTVEYAV